MVTAILTEIRKDGMQKWERNDKVKSDHMRYVWLSPYQSKAGVKIGDEAQIEFHKGTGGIIGGHWAGWKIVKII